MASDLHWAARYQFLDELWRAQDRLVFDPAVEAAVQEGGPGVAHGSDQPLMDLFDELVPRDSQDAQAWVVVEAGPRAAEYARLRAGTVFVGAEEAAEVAAEEPWQVALVDVGARVQFEADPEDPEAVLASIDAEFAAFVELLSEGADEGNTVVLWMAVPSDERGRELAFAGFQSFIDDHFDDARLFGSGPVNMQAFYDFGPEGEDEDVGIDFDNRLGEDPPSLTGILAIAGAEVETDGLTLMELPALSPRPATGARRGSGEPAGVREQLEQARRATDEASIERQRLIERLDTAEDRCAELEERLANHGGEEGPEDSARLDAALAREQTARWQINRLEGEVESLRGRPVGELEAEIARLESLLREADDRASSGPQTGAGEASSASEASAGAHHERHPDALRGKLDRLLRRLERGGMPTLELHAELLELRARIE